MLVQLLDRIQWMTLWFYLIIWNKTAYYFDIFDLYGDVWFFTLLTNFILLILMSIISIAAVCCCSQPSQEQHLFDLHYSYLYPFMIYTLLPLLYFYLSLAKSKKLFK